MQNCNAAALPAIPGCKYTKADCPATDEAKADILCAAGNSTQTLVFSTSKLRSMPSVSSSAGTKHYGIEFNWFADHPEPPDARGPLHMVAYSDSSFADDVDTARTTLGFVIQVNGASVSAASWMSQRVDSCMNVTTASSTPSGA